MHEYNREKTIKRRGLKHTNMERICKELAGRLGEGNFITTRFPLEMLLTEKLSEHTVNRMLAAYTYIHDLHHLQDDFFFCKYSLMDKIPS